MPMKKSPDTAVHGPAPARTTTRCSHSTEFTKAVENVYASALAQSYRQHGMHIDLLIWQCLDPQLLTVSMLASLVIVAIHPRSVMHRSGPGSTDKINAQKDAHASLKTLIGNGAHTLGSVSDFTSGSSSALLLRSTGSMSDDADIIGITRYCASCLAAPCLNISVQGLCTHPD